jgi:hypothetical protein
MSAGAAGSVVSVGVVGEEGFVGAACAVAGNANVDATARQSPAFIRLFFIRIDTTRSPRRLLPH